METLTAALVKALQDVRPKPTVPAPVPPTPIDVRVQEWPSFARQDLRDIPTLQESGWAKAMPMTVGVEAEDIGAAVRLLAEAALDIYDAIRGQAGPPAALAHAGGGHVVAWTPLVTRWGRVVLSKRFRHLLYSPGVALKNLTGSTFEPKQPVINKENGHEFGPPQDLSWVCRRCHRCFTPLANMVQGLDGKGLPPCRGPEGLYEHSFANSRLAEALDGRQLADTKTRQAMADAIRAQTGAKVVTFLRWDTQRLSGCALEVLRRTEAVQGSICSYDIEVPARPGESQNPEAYRHVPTYERRVGLAAHVCVGAYHDRTQAMRVLHGCANALAEAGLLLPFELLPPVMAEFGPGHAMVLWKPCLRGIATKDGLDEAQRLLGPWLCPEDDAGAFVDTP